MKIQSNENTLYTFDLFDTLIKRDVSNPRQLFFRKSVFFAVRRISAELVLRVWRRFTQSSDREIDIFDIYRLMWPYRLSSELDLEINSLRINPIISDVYLEKRNLGFQTAIVSDMYWPSDYLKIILNSLNLPHDDNLFVSCDFGVSKATGLFEIVKDCMINDKNSGVIHTGDNLNSDVYGAIKSGIFPILYEK